MDRKLVGVLLLTFVSICLIVMRMQLDEPIYTTLIIISILCLSVTLYFNDKRLDTVPVIYVLLILLYLLLTIGKAVGDGIQVFCASMIIILLVYMFYLVNGNAIRYILIIPAGIAIYILWQLMQGNGA